MGRLVATPIRLRGRRAHTKLDRTLDQGERLALTVDGPPAFAPVLELYQLGIDLLELV